jgi:hypothetical protein
MMQQLRGPEYEFNAVGYYNGTRMRSLKTQPVGQSDSPETRGGNSLQELQ